MTLANMASHSGRDSFGSPNSDPELRSNLPPQDAGTRAYLALVGCCILQLPIWGFSISYGVFQEHYSSSSDLAGNRSATGIVGTTLTGITYLSMPFLFANFANRYAHLRRTFALAGILTAATSLILSSFADKAWQLVLTQGVLLAIGSTMLYSSTTTYIDEWFLRRKGFAYGVILSTKSAVGVGSPILFGELLSSLGARTTLRIWAAIVFSTSLPCLFLLRPRVQVSRQVLRNRRISWKFLTHPTFYVFQLANIIFSASYGMPQTYLSSFARGVLDLSTPRNALMLALLNAPSIIASSLFGTLSDGTAYYHGRSMSVSTITTLAAVGSCLPVFLLWGFASSSNNEGVVLLTIFAIVYGFFAGGYSATWGGIVKEVEKEATDNGEAVDTSLLYGLLNGGRGIGFVAGGFAGVELLKAGSIGSQWAFGSEFGSLIIFTGIGAAFGGCTTLWRLCKVLKM